MSDEEDASAGRTDTSSEASSSEAEAELMITTRERRKTAGNRYSQVVAQEQAEEDEQDDVALLFADAEGEGEDKEYNSDEGDDEADMSSSDDDDQGPNVAAENMDGEKEIEKQAKAERQKKRKADMALTSMSGIRKKPKIDPTSLHRAPERNKPSKRKDRVSWLPDEAAGSGRTSLRKQTVAHREVMLERLKESEELRLKNKAIREEKEKIKQADAPKELTQADRLAEAEKNERRNAKSLNRWETQEARRAEEQAAKLAALKERKLNGAVITFHSSRHVYRGTRVEGLSPGPSGTDDGRPKKRGPKPKGLQQQSGTPSQLPVGTFVQSPFTSIAANINKAPFSSTPATPAPTPPEDPGTQASGNDWLAGIHDYASMQPSPGQITPRGPRDKAIVPQQSHVVETTQQPQLEQRPQHNVPPDNGQPLPRSDTDLAKSLAGPSVKIDSTTQKLETETRPSMPSNLPAVTDTMPSSTSSTAQSDIQRSQQPPTQIQPLLLPQPQGTVPPAIPSHPQVHVHPPLLPWPIASQLPEQVKIQPTPMIEVTSTRNLVILDRPEDLTTEARQAYAVLTNTKKSMKPTKQAAETCAITGLPAKYRDPATGAGYANVAAFKKLRDLQKHAYQWSSMLGCYVGKAGQVARGAPEGFLGG